jgi:plastocyanin
MKKLNILFILLAITASNAFSTKHTITNVGTTFSPNDITIDPGDTVVFSIASFHNAVEVSQETWNANGTTSNGGFSLPNGGGSVAFPTAGIHYYVCQPHASLGMKGIIRVGTVSDINSIDNQSVNLSVYPNPAVNRISISYTLNNPSDVAIDLVNLSGAQVKRILVDQQNAGAQNTDVDLNSINAGIYFIEMKVGDAEIVRKLIIR